MSKIVNTDSFGRDYPDEVFVLWRMPEEDAEAICDILNKRGGEHASRYFKVVGDDYTLQPGFEP